jgi:hypothetical protein
MERSDVNAYSSSLEASIERFDALLPYPADLTCVANMVTPFFASMEELN